MQSTGKIIVWIVVALIVIGGLYYWYTTSKSAMPASDAVSAAPSDTTQTQSGLASGSDTSDAALSQDLSGMDGQMSAMNSDTASIDSGMNDKQVQQDY